MSNPILSMWTTGGFLNSEHLYSTSKEGASGVSAAKPGGKSTLYICLNIECSKNKHTEFKGPLRCRLLEFMWTKLDVWYCDKVTHYVLISTYKWSEVLGSRMVTKLEDCNWMTNNNAHHLKKKNNVCCIQQFLADTVGPVTTDNTMHLLNFFSTGAP